MQAMLGPRPDNNFRIRPCEPVRMGRQRRRLALLFAPVPWWRFLALSSGWLLILHFPPRGAGRFVVGNDVRDKGRVGSFMSRVHDTEGPYGARG